MQLQSCGEPGDLDRPHRAILRVEARYSSDLFNEMAHQAKPVPLAFGSALNPWPSSLMVMVAVSTSPKALRTDTMIDPLPQGTAWS